MKRIIILLAILFSAYYSFGQGVVQRTNGSTTPLDVRLMTSKNFYMPRVSCGGDLMGGVDTLGALVYSMCDSSIYYYIKGGQWLKLSKTVSEALLKSDSSLYVTVTRLNDSLAVLRGVIANRVSENTTLTINGLAQDLSQNRTWNVGTLVSADTVFIHNKLMSAFNNASFDTSARALKLFSIQGDSLSVLIPAGSGGGGGGGPTDFSWNVTGLTVTQLWNTGPTHSFTIPTNGESGLYRSGTNIRLGTNPLLEDATIPTNSHNLILSGRGTSAGTSTDPDYTFRVTNSRAGVVSGLSVQNTDSTSSPALGISGDSIGVSGSVFVTNRKYVPSIDGFFAQPRRLYMQASSSLRGITIKSRTDTSNIIMQVSSDTLAILDTAKSLFTKGFGVGPEYNDKPIPGDPPHKFNVIADNQYLAQFTAYAPNAGLSNIHVRKARGSWASPSALLSGDFLVSMGFRGYDGTGFAQSSGAFQFLTTENFDATHNGTMAQLGVTANGNFGANRTIAMKWNQDATIDVVNTIRSTSSGAIPLAMTRTPNTTYGIWDLRLTGDPQGLGGVLDDASLTIHNGRGFGDFAIATKFSDQPNFVIKQSGNIGMGVTSPSANLEIAGQIKINGGAPGAGKVLTSDGVGLASWQTPSTGVTSYNGRTGAVTGILTDVTSALGYTPLNPSIYPVNSGGETWQSVMARGNTSNINAVINGTNVIPFRMDRTSFGSWDFRLTSNPQSLGAVLDDLSMTIHNNNTAGDFAIANTSSAQPNFIIKQNGNILINGTTDNGVKFQNNGSAYFGSFVSTSIPFTAQYSNVAGNSLVYFNNTNTAAGTVGLNTNIASTDATSTAFRVGSGGTARLSVNGDGSIIANAFSAGSLSDSLVTQNASTGKLFRISPNRFTFQAVTTNGNSTTNDVFFGKHLYFNTTSPSVTLSSGASWTGTYSITGTDQSGVISIVISSGTGSASTGGDLLNITFGQAFSGSTPRVIVAAADNATAAAFSRIFGTVATSTGWRLSTTPALSGVVAGQYFFNYHVF